jgi:LmbE family N-acetylglucosaminyl deacetylase
MSKTILIFCAHSDDEAVGMGGTIAKYVDEGKKIIKIVFSYGESSHPHFKEHVVKKKRTKETDDANEFLGIDEVIFLGLKDTKVKEEVEEQGTKDRIKELIREHNPERIFLPSIMDPHPDHRAVNKTVLEAVDEIKKKYNVFAFEVWNVVKETNPVYYVDITPYFKKKIEFMKKFRSQWLYMYLLLIPVHLRSRQYGRKHGCKYAEKFYKLR